jgi:hypothetical protein
MRLQWDGRQGSREKKPQTLCSPTPYEKATMQAKGTAATLPARTQTALPLPSGQANWPELGRRTTHATGRVQGCYSHAERRESAA